MNKNNFDSYLIRILIGLAVALTAILILNLVQIALIVHEPRKAVQVVDVYSPLVPRPNQECFYRLSDNRNIAYTCNALKKGDRVVVGSRGEVLSVNGE